MVAASASPFVVPVGELLRHPGRTRSVRVEAPVDWALADSAVLRQPPLLADLELTAIPGGLVIRGVVEVTMRSTCARCLAETEHVHRAEIGQLARPAEETATDEDGEVDDGYRLDGDLLDLEPLLRDEVLLALPVVWRCDPPCAGVGEARQTGLNTAAPGRRSESPFAALQDLLDPGE